MRIVVVLTVLITASVSHSQEVGKCYYVNGTLGKRISATEYMFTTPKDNDGKATDGFVTVPVVNGDMSWHPFKNMAVEFKGMKNHKVTSSDGKVTKYSLPNYEANDRCFKELLDKIHARQKDLIKQVNDAAKKQAFAKEVEAAKQKKLSEQVSKESEDPTK